MVLGVLSGCLNADTTPEEDDNSIPAYESKYEATYNLSGEDNDINPYLNYAGNEAEEHDEETDATSEEYNKTESGSEKDCEEIASDNKEDADNTENVFIQFVQIYEGGPRLEIIRTIVDFEPDVWQDIITAFRAFPVPDPVEVEIVIKDEGGYIIQVISGLTQNIRFAQNMEGPSFSDYNFDGYLDMRLLRWQDGAGGRLAHEYFWLWCNEISQFVLNEQLIEIGNAANLFADQETRQIEVWHRVSSSPGFWTFYEYHNGSFVCVDYDFCDATNPFILDEILLFIEYRCSP